MKKINLLILLLFVSLIFSFNTIHAQVPTDDVNKLVQVKGIRQSIRHHLKANHKLEKEIEKKSKQIEKVLVKLPENSLVPQRVIDEEISPKLEGIMTHLMRIGKYETVTWERLNRGNKQIENKKYNAGIKNLEQADAALKSKHEVMIIFKEDLNEFLVFIESLQHK